MIDWIIAIWLIADVPRVAFGLSLCFHSLKWRRSALACAAVFWGLAVGGVVGYGVIPIWGIEGLAFFAALGMAVFPVLAYAVPCVNRFVLGFVFGSKIVALFTAAMFGEGIIEPIFAINIPLFVGAIFGFVVMAWVRIHVFPLVLGCTFVGVSDVVSAVTEWINRVYYIKMAEDAFLEKPTNLFFALIKIPVAGRIVLIAMIALVLIASISQTKDLRSKGISWNKPTIGFDEVWKTER